MDSRSEAEMELVAGHAGELGLSADKFVTPRRASVVTETGLVSALRWQPAEEARIVLLHGGGQNAHTWDGVLLRSRLPALAVDLPGHGRSSWFEECVYLPTAMARPVQEVADQLAPRAPVLVGMSLGGLTAIVIAAAEARVRSLVLLDISPDVGPDHSPEIRELMARDRFEDFDALLAHTARYRPGQPLPSLRRSLLYNAQEGPDGIWTWRHDRRDPELRYRRIYEEAPRLWSRVAQLECAVTLVLGDRSSVVSAADVQKFCSLAPQTRVVRVPGAGHHVHTENPQLVGTLLRLEAQRP